MRDRRGRKHGARCKHSLRDAEPLGAKDEVVAVRELECAAADTVGGVLRQRTGAGPHLCGALFEFGEDALLFEAGVGVGGCGAGGEGAEGCFGGFSDLDGDLGEDLVVCGERHALGGEVGADLGAEEVAAERGAQGSFLEDEAVMDRGHRDVGAAYVDDQA